MEFLKSITGKIVSGLVALVVIASGISWWRMDEATRAGLLSGTGRIFSWLGVVLFLPWATFWLIGWVGKRDSNVSGAVLVSSYTLVELLVLLWLFGFSVHGAVAWTFLVVGVLFAGVYNLFTCDWLAEKVAK